MIVYKNADFYINDEIQKGIFSFTEFDDEIWISSYGLIPNVNRGSIINLEINYYNPIVDNALPNENKLYINLICIKKTVEFQTDEVMKVNYRFSKES